MANNELGDFPKKIPIGDSVSALTLTTASSRDVHHLSGSVLISQNTRPDAHLVAEFRASKADRQWMTSRINVQHGDLCGPQVSICTRHWLNVKAHLKSLDAPHLGTSGHARVTSVTSQISTTGWEKMLTLYWGQLTSIWT